jgi:hypothetical protein
MPDAAITEPGLMEAIPLSKWVAKTSIFQTLPRRDSKN